MRVLGVDPGYERLGLAVLEKNSGSKEYLIYSDCFKTSKDSDFTERLKLIAGEVQRITEEFKPEFLAIENLFFNKNQKTAMRVSETRGAILSLGMEKGLVVREFTPLQIKIAVTGYGRGDKKQVMSMIPQLVEIKKKISSDDEFDAIAVALTCLATIKSPKN